MPEQRSHGKHRFETPHDFSAPIACAQQLGGVAKLRLVNGINGLAGNISLTVDANLVAQNVALGTASAAGTVVTTSNVSQLQVDGPGNVSLGTSGATPKSEGVYSVFTLGDNTAPVEIVRADR